MTEKDRLLEAAKAHVPFDGWSEASLLSAAKDCGLSGDQAHSVFARGALDLALAYHRDGDAKMVASLRAANLDDMRFRDRIAAGVRFRLEAGDKELVRKGMAFFALPQNASEGAGALWATCGLIWETLGDTSVDLNWYTKRVTLSAVYSSVVLFWLGDTSEGDADTWAFLDRRIDDVMQIEKIKGQARGTSLYKVFISGPGKLLDAIKAPAASHENYPGRWSDDEASKD
jgi:ubiquinone biosynthesis protein COQ9